PRPALAPAPRLRRRGGLASPRAPTPPSRLRPRLTEARQYPLCGFELVQLFSELRPLGLHPRQPFGNALPLRCNIVQRGHGLSVDGLASTAKALRLPNDAIHGGAQRRKKPSLEVLCN